VQYNTAQLTVVQNCDTAVQCITAHRRAVQRFSVKQRVTDRSKQAA
jgi:hypothetical protein